MPELTGLDPRKNFTTFQLMLSLLITTRIHAQRQIGDEMAGNTDDKKPYPWLRNITDCHMHLIGPEHRLPFSPGLSKVFPEWFGADYKKMAESAGIERSVITQPPFYGPDNRNLLDGLSQLGAHAKGIAVVNANLPDRDYLELQSAGVVGANFYLMPDGELDWSSVSPTNERIQDFGWQTQLQFNGREMVSRFGQISALKGPLVIDHIGKFQPSVDTSDIAFRQLCRLLDSGRCYVKLSAPYESSSNESPYWQQAGSLARFLIKEYPYALVWGSNWPHLGLKRQSDWPSTEAALRCLDTWGADNKILEQILVTTPTKLFGFDL